MNKCIICGNKIFRRYTRGGKGYSLQQCTRCKLVFDNNLTVNQRVIYNENYFTSQEIKGGYYNYFEESRVNKLTFEYRLHKIAQKKNPQESKLLDFGCATGDFLEVCRNLSWEDSVGIDISEYAIKQGKNKGLKVYVQDKASASLQKNYYDVITLQDVVEHFKNPQEEINHIYQMLKNDGVLFMTTPNVGSISEKILGSFWYHYKQSEHLFYFNSQNIKTFLSEAGFSNIRVSHTPSWVNVQYLANRFSYYFPLFQSSIIQKVFNNPLAQIVFPIYTGEMEIWAEKTNKHK